MLQDIIRGVGVRAVARECGVDHGAVLYWCRAGLPKMKAHRERRAHYERQIAKLAGMKVGDLRKQIAEEEAAKAA